VIAGVGIGALAFGGEDDGDGGGSGSALASKAPIDLPEELAGFTDVVVKAEQDKINPRAAEQQRTRIEKVAANTEKAYSEAFGGASSAFRVYADAALEKRPSVIVVRAEAPGLVIGPVEDPASLRLAAPPQEVKRYGEVSCHINSLQVTAEGQRPDPDNQAVVSCQRAGDGVTAFVYGAGGFRGTAGIQQAVDLTSAAWEAAKG
jgi:hypothetical protein